MSFATRHPATLPVFAAAVAVAFCWPSVLASQVAADFDRDIRPIISDHCLECHGPDSRARKAKLRLDDRTGLLSVVVPGDPAASELIRRVSTHDLDDRMPPPEHDGLGAGEVELLTRWVREGAEWSPHWAFVAPQRPAVPDVAGDWVANEIDAFVLERLGREGLTPQPRASREKQLRRLTLDLTGLPPTPEELDRFLADEAPDAYERAVDALFASPRYAERRTADWLDAARYADSNGFQNDFGRNMWPWRDWVLRAFSSNMPFDRFVIEQIAGDLLPNATLDQRIATGFQRNHRSTTEGGSIEEEWRIENVMDRTETNATVFLGMTLGCARCHDHKFDPISQEDFYEFFAFFNNTTEKGFHSERRGNVPPMVKVPTAENEARLAKFEEDSARLKDEIAAAAPRVEKEFHQWLEKQRDRNSVAPAPQWHARLRFDLGLRPTNGASIAGSSPQTPRFTTKKSEGRGPWARSLALDGSPKTCVDYGKSIEFERDRSFSFAAWVKTPGDGTIFSRMDGQKAYRGVDMLLIDGGSLTAHLITQWPQKAIKVQSKWPVPKSTWTHVAFTYDGSSKAAGVQLYISGAPVDHHVRRDSLDGTIHADVPLVLGKRHLAPTLRGRLSDFRIYDRALSDGEVRELVDATIREVIGNSDDARSDAELLAYYEEHETGGEGSPKRRLAKLERQLADYRKNEIPTTMVLAERKERRPTYVLHRGLYDAPQQDRAVEPAIPAFLPPLADDLPRNRLGFARWLVDPGNPLTARVAVNRMWQQFFGEGLVPSSENFGVRGVRPVHRELLDWLATELVRSGWDLRALQKRIVTSSTYRQRSRVTSESWRRDPRNRLYARGPRFRMPAEMVRDNALAVSGLLVETLGGPPVKPYQPDGLWRELAGGAGQGPYKQDRGDALYRRSLYVYRKRTVPHPTMSTFDAPSWEFCQVDRGRTNTPLQALALLNDTTYVEAARHLAALMMQKHDSEDARIRHGFRRATARFPTTAELEILRAGLADYRSSYSRDADSAQSFVGVGDSPLPEIPEGDTIADLAAYTAIAGVILNLDETITKD